MATFIVKADNGGTDSANAYITTTFFRDYHRARGNEVQTISGTTYSTSDWQKAIVRASDYLDTRFSFIGIRRTASQTTEWPRYNVEDRNGFIVSDIPEEVKEACAEYALISLTTTINPSPTRDDRGQGVQSKMEKVDVLEEETVFATGDSFYLPRHPAADLKLTRAGFVVQGMQVRRGD